MDHIERTVLTVSATAAVSVSAVAFTHRRLAIGLICLLVGGILFHRYHRETVADEGFSDEEMEQAADDIANAAEIVYEQAYHQGRSHGVEDSDDGDERAYQ